MSNHYSKVFFRQITLGVVEVLRRELHRPLLLVVSNRDGVLGGELSIEPVLLQIESSVAAAIHPIHLNGLFTLSTIKICFKLFFDGNLVGHEVGADAKPIIITPSILENPDLRREAVFTRYEPSPSTFVSDVVLTNELDRLGLRIRHHFHWSYNLAIRIRKK